LTMTIVMLEMIALDLQRDRFFIFQSSTLRRPEATTSTTCRPQPPGNAVNAFHTTLQAGKMFGKNDC